MLRAGEKPIWFPILPKSSQFSWVNMTLSKFYWLRLFMFHSLARRFFWLRVVLADAFLPVKQLMKLVELLFGWFLWDLLPSSSLLVEWAMGRLVLPVARAEKRYSLTLLWFFLLKFSKEGSSSDTLPPFLLLWWLTSLSLFRLFKTISD